MGKHDGHLPRKDLNKAVGPGQVSDPEDLGRLARGQGKGSKEDAKDAKKTK